MQAKLNEDIHLTHCYCFQYEQIAENRGKTCHNVLKMHLCSPNIVTGEVDMLRPSGEILKCQNEIIDPLKKMSECQKNDAILTKFEP